jgi:tetratricopeptide (TPR) repeat protein
MKKIIFLSLLVFSGFLATSCKKFLSPQPEQLLLSDSAITSVNDVNVLLISAYDALQSGNVLGGMMNVYGEMMSDDSRMNENRLTPFGTQEIYNGTTSIQIGSLRDMWRDCYTAVSRANYVLDAIDNNPAVQNDPTYARNNNRIRGEALFIRAVVHFELMRFWSMPYNTSNPGENSADQSGVILRTKPVKKLSDDYKQKRATIEECYTQIIQDLKDADVALSNAGILTSNKFASAYAAKAVLTRVLFCKGDYAQAINYAKEVINSNKYVLADSLQLYYAANGTPASALNETIFGLQNIANDNSNALPNWFFNRGGAVAFNVATDIYNGLPATDRRKTMIFPTQVSKKFSYVTGTGNLQVSSNLIYIRLAELYLTLAESQMMQGNATDALAAYNKIRQRAFKNNYVAETSTVGLLEKIQNERRIELLFEGDRYLNLRRMQKPLRKGGPEVYRQFLFKIPQEEISANPDIRQN